ncbi:NADH-quinone oxidoreductase subunit K [Cysteiniphilum sp. 6C5]|uniref:NADH-quinone oxidoreductase subunit K n=1 Tax=unclassified Cysteiniphilum TaxID=2610889 RepID=UPI003F86B463
MIVFACGVLISISIYLLLDRNIIRRVFGIILLGSTINIIILICGRLGNTMPAFIIDKQHALSNPLTQALVLTAIVIGFGLLAFLCALIKSIMDKQDD